MAKSEFVKAIENSGKIISSGKYAKIFATTLVASLVILAFLYGFFNIPFLDFGFMRMSTVTLFDYAFIFLTAVFMAALISITFYSKDEASSVGASAASSGGLVAGLIAASCPACQGIQLVAFGANLFLIPLGPLLPYLDLLKVLSLGVMGLAFYTTSKSVYTKTCIGSEPIAKKGKDKPSGFADLLLENRLGFSALLGIIALMVFNQVLLFSMFSAAYPAAGTAAAITAAGGTTIIAGDLSYSSNVTLKPMPLAVGEDPAIAGYKTKVKSLPTISQLAITPPTGDVVQDLVNNVVPHGTPWYSEAAGGVSFDDPIAAQQLWGRGEGIQLDSADEQRWSKIVNAFTCDYCCGSPQNPTIITRCGCAHARAARGMAKWFISTYGDQYSDEEIYGEMARWYALWYPGPTVKRIAQEIQAQGY